MYALNPHLKIFQRDNKVYGQLKEDILEISKNELLVLKIIAESLNPVEISKRFNISPQLILYSIEDALNKNFIIKKEPLIKRDSKKYLLKIEDLQDKYIYPEVFILQWHITNQCDLNCKHCYDRSKREEPLFEEAEKIMEDFYLFCFKFSVYPQITFTGGNPFLHKNFIQIYKKASEMGIITGILGNPVSEEKLARINEIQKPSFYQVSLEGLENYNDYIRGKGHFKKTINFLKLLKKYNIHSNVMLTLHKENINQVFDLIEKLEGIADSFTFNRLSLVGEGKNLNLFTKEEYIDFLKKYIKISKTKDFVRLKDNLINVLLYKDENIVFGGCTGFGCGAAFNFVALLPDGEVHACRKFPSFIGNIKTQSFEDIYLSEKAEIFRSVPEECSNCPINRVCRGCLAVSYSLKKDIKAEKDLFCFYNN